METATMVRGAGFHDARARAGWASWAARTVLAAVSAWAISCGAWLKLVSEMRWGLVAGRGMISAVGAYRARSAWSRVLRRWVSALAAAAATLRGGRGAVGAAGSLVGST